MFLSNLKYNFSHLIFVTTDFEKSNFIFYLLKDIRNNIDKQDNIKKVFNIFELIFEKSRIQAVEFINFFIDKILGTTTLKKLNEIFSFSIVLRPGKKISKNLSFLYSDKFKIFQKNFNHLYKDFHDFQNGIFVSNLFVIGSYIIKRKISCIEKYELLLLRKKTKKIIKMIYMNSNSSKMKSSRFLLNQLILIFSNEIIKLNLKTIELEILKRVKKKKQFILRNNEISPSISRIFKTIIHNFSCLVRQFVKPPLTETFIVLILRFHQNILGITFLQFYFFKYMQFCTLDNINNLLEYDFFEVYDLKNILLGNFSNYFQPKEVVFSNVFMKIQKKNFLMRSDLKFEKISLTKKISLVLKDFNYIKVNRYRINNKIRLDGNVLDKRSLNELNLFINKKKNTNVSTLILYIKKFKKDLRENRFIGYFSLKKIKENFESITLFGIFISLFFNNRYNEIFLIKFFQQNPIFKLELWLMEIKSLKYVDKISKKMNDTEKFFFIKTGRSFFTKNIFSFVFFIKKFYTIVSKGLFYNQEEHSCYLNFCINILRQNECRKITFHINNFFFLMFSKYSFPFFYKKFESWILEFIFYSKIIKKVSVDINFFFIKMFKHLKKILKNLLNKNEFDPNFKSRYLQKAILRRVFIILLIYFLKKDIFLRGRHFFKHKGLNKKIFDKDKIDIKFLKLSERKISSFIFVELFTNYVLLFEKKPFLNMFSSIYSYSMGNSKLYRKLIFLSKFLFFYNQEGNFLNEEEFKMNTHIKTLDVSDTFLEIKFKSILDYENSFLFKDFFHIEFDRSSDIFKEKHKLDDEDIFFLKNPTIFPLFIIFNKYLKKFSKITDIIEIECNNKKFRRNVVDINIENWRNKKNSSLEEKFLENIDTKSSIIRLRKFIFNMIYRIEKVSTKESFFILQTVFRKKKEQFEIEIRFFLSAFGAKFLPRVKQLSFIVYLNSINKLK